MSAPNDVSTGEVFRALGKVERALDEGFKTVNTRIDKLETNFVSKELYEARHSALEDRIDSIETTADKAVSNRLTKAGLWIAVVDAIASATYALAHLH